MPLPEVQIRFANVGLGTLDQAPRLPEWESLTISQVFNDVTTIDLQVPKRAVNYTADPAVPAMPNIFKNVQLPKLAFYWAGNPTEPFGGEIQNTRCTIEDVQYDPFDYSENQIYSFIGMGTLARAGHISTFYQASRPAHTVARTGTVGQVLNQMTTWFQERQSDNGAFFYRTWNWLRRDSPSFDNISAFDSTGAAWPATVWNLNINVGETLLDRIRDFVDQKVLYVKAEIESTGSDCIGVFKSDYGVDRTIGANQIMLHVGRDIKGGSAKETMRNYINWLGLAYSDGTKYQVAQAMLGTWFGIREYAPPTITSIPGGGGNEVSIYNERKRQTDLTVNLCFTEGSYGTGGSPVPGRDYLIGDWIWIHRNPENWVVDPSDVVTWTDTSTLLDKQRVKVKQFTITFGPNGKPVSGTLVCDTLTEPPARSMRTDIRRIFRKYYA